VPVHQNVLFGDPESARDIPRGDLDLCCCERCGFVFNRAFDPSLLSYDQAYENTQTCSEAFGDYVEGLVRHLVQQRGVRNCSVVEVGCGKGEFLRRLVDQGRPGVTAVGFDPSYVGPVELYDGRLRFVRGFFDEGAADVGADVVVCRHVIEHVAAPRRLLDSVRRALRTRPDARVFFETPCVRWILDHRVVWDFFYEHCSLFTARSLSSVFALSGFETTSVSHLFGGQYLWFEGRVAPVVPEPDFSAGGLPALAADFGRAEHDMLRRWDSCLGRSAAAGRLALWGAGAKGVTLANLIDAEGQRIDSVIDVNPAKQGGYLPGTGHPIVPPAHVLVRDIAAVVVMNPNYFGEIRETLRALDCNAELIHPDRVE
jgi:SAM-dependent methyltransferase